MNKKLVTIAVVILIIIGGFIVWINSNLDRDIKEITQGSQFKIESTDKYSIYYPSTYVKGVPENDEVFIFENPDTQAVESEKLIMGIQEGPGFGVANFQACETLSKALQQSNEDEITVRVAVGQTVGSGCGITIETPIPGTTDSAVTEVKYLWYPDSATDKNLYSVRAVYFGVASAKQAEVLRASVLQFTLK